MRIIGGNFKGKKIFLPKDQKTRPLRDLVKESIFNLIEHSKKFECSVKNSNVLDLFSGSGSFGIECISRNAKKVTFIENYKEALSILRKNISLIKSEKKTQIIEEDCFNYLKKDRILSKKFDIIFLDPPYKEKNLNSLIDLIIDKKILDKKGILIIHRHKKDDLEISKKIQILDERNYGISKIVFGS